MRAMLGIEGYSAVEYMGATSLDAHDAVFPLISGMLNGFGGALVFGLEKSAGGDARALGLSYSAEEVGKFEKSIADRITPMSPIFVHMQKVQNGSVVVVEVPAGREPPYAYDNTIFELKDGCCAPASMSTVREWVIMSRTGLERWENRSSIAGLSETIDRLELRHAIQEVRRNGRFDIEELMDDEMALKAFGALRYGRLLNAGLVLFAKTPSRVAPQVLVRFTHYAGSSTDSPIVSTRVFDGPLCAVIDGVRDYIVEKSPAVVDFDSVTGNRIEQIVYPALAVREALVNACAHRDYESSFGGVSVLLFSNRLLIRNSGKLPEGVSLSALNKGKGAASVLRNPTICAHLYARKYMERAGRGSALIPMLSKKVGTTVRWDCDEAMGVSVTFKPKNLLTRKDFNGKGESLNESLNDKSFLRKLQKNVLLNNELRYVYDIIIGNPGLRYPSLEVLTGKSRGSLQRVINKLRTVKLVTYEGSKKTGGFRGCSPVR